MKVRFYHWWAYRLYRWLWGPLMKDRPEFVKSTRDWSCHWKVHLRRERIERWFMNGYED